MGQRWGAPARNDAPMIQPALPFRAVSRVYFFCAKCGVPAVWRIDYADGSFWTVCDMHFHILIRVFPQVEVRSRALLPDEAPGLGMIVFHGPKKLGGVVCGGKGSPA